MKEPNLKFFLDKKVLKIFYKSGSRMKKIINVHTDTMITK